MYVVKGQEGQGGHTGTGVWIHYCNALLAGSVLEEALFGAVVAGACQSREVEQYRNLFALGSLRWEVEVELHLAVCGCCLVSKLEQLAPERGNGRGGFDRHL